MQFKTFDNTAKPPHKKWSTVLFLTMNERGKVNFSQAARRHFSLNEGDKVVFHQNLEFRSEWYIEFTNENKGYKLVFGATDTRITTIHPITEIFKSIGKQLGIFHF